MTDTNKHEDPKESEGNADSMVEYDPTRNRPNLRRRPLTSAERQMELPFPSDAKTLLTRRNG